MSDTAFASLPPAERVEALEVAARLSSRSAHLLEKDIWVVAVLRALFSTPFANELVFKGGTSLAKAWGAIRRFSEDVDVTYDIRAIAPDLVRDAGVEALPPTRSQEQRWTRVIRARLGAWVVGQARPTIQEGIARAGLDAQVSRQGDRVHVDYEQSFEGHGFVRPTVVVEFGARSTGEPHQIRPVRCEAAQFLPGLAFPEARPSVMLAERTFWEKATAMHVFCERGRGRGDRLTRHWHDLVHLDRTGIAERALADGALAWSVARNKASFFREKDSEGGWISYEKAVSGGLRLVPSGAGVQVLAADYADMLREGMLPDDAESFEELMDACADLERRANSR